MTIRKVTKTGNNPVHLSVPTAAEDELFVSLSPTDSLICSSADKERWEIEATIKELTEINTFHKGELVHAETISIKVSKRLGELEARLEELK